MKSFPKTIALTLLGAVLGLLLAAQRLSSEGVVNSCTQAELEAALKGGGTVTFDCDGTITFANSVTISEDTLISGKGHSVTLSGGNAVRVFTVAAGARLALVNLTIANGYWASTNSACGGAIFNNGGMFAATNCTFASNGVAGVSAPSFGGALCNSNGSALLAQCSFLNNRAAGGEGVAYVDANGKAGNGGAIHNGGELVVIGSSFEGNVAIGGQGRVAGPNLWDLGGGGAGLGGAIFNGGTLLVTNTTFATNSALGAAGINYLGKVLGAAGAARGGAVYSYGNNSALVHATIAVNSARTLSYHPVSTARGAGVSGANLTLINTIVSSNVSEYFFMKISDNFYGSISDGGHNMSSDGSLALSASGSLTNTDPMLGPLGNQGGPTRVFPLREGSPAIDAGDDATAGSVATDQRGYARLSGPHVDIGAVEFQRVIQPLQLDSVSLPAIGHVKLIFRNTPDGPTFTVLAASDVASPTTNWSNLGLATQTMPGEFQFVDTGATNFPWRFYRLRSP